MTRPRGRRPHGDQRKERSPGLVVILIDESGVVELAQGDGLQLLGLSPMYATQQRADELLAEQPALLDGIERAHRAQQSRSKLEIDRHVLDIGFYPRLDKEGRSRGCLISGHELRGMGRRNAGFERNLRRILAQVPVSLWVVDTKLVVRYALGQRPPQLSKTNVVGYSLLELLGSGERQEPLIERHRAALAGERQSFRSSVGDHCFEVILEPVRTASGRALGVAGAALDITDRYRVEQQLRESQRALEDAQEVAHIGTWEWDIEADRVVWSKELFRIYDIEPSQFTGNFKAFVKRVHPDDRERARSVIFEAVHHGSQLSYDHRIIRPDGSVRMLRTAARVLDAHNGRPRRMAGSCWDITDLWRTIEERKRSVSLLQAALDATVDGILVVDTEGKIRACNSRFVSMWHAPVELTAKGSSHEPLLTSVLGQTRDPDAFEARVRELYATPEAESSDIVTFTDGRVLERYSGPQRVDGKVVGRVWGFHDITERERLLQQALFFSRAGQLLATLDVEVALKAVAQMTVPTWGDGCTIDLLVDEEGPQRLVSVLREGAKSLPIETPSRALRGNPVVWEHEGLACMSLPIAARGSPLGVLTFVARGRRYDRSDLTFAADLSRRMAVALENAHLFRATQEGVRARDEFLSIAAHELRGPLTALQLGVQAWRQGRVERAYQERVLSIVEREAGRLERLIDELLDVARIRAGRLHFELEELDLTQAAGEAIAGLAHELQASGSSLFLEAKEPVWGSWDRTRLQQVVTNLVSNAIKFGRGGPIRVEISANDSSARLVVEDHGTGIQSDMQAKIFDPFARAVSTRNYGGLGLGLYIVRTIVEGLGGHIEVHSKPEAGSTFIAELPIVHREQPQPYTHH